MSTVLEEFAKILQNEKLVDKFEKTYKDILAWMEDESNETNGVPTALVTCMKRDLKRAEKMISSASVQLLTHFFGDSNLLSSVGNVEMLALLTELISTTASTESISECFNRIYSTCQTKSVYDHRTLIKTVQSVVLKDAKNRVQDALKMEMLEYVSNLVSDGEEQREECKLQCLELVLLLTADLSKNIRKKAIEISQATLQVWPIKPTYITPIATCLKLHIVPKIKAIHSKEASALCEVLTGQWPLFLKIMGVNVKKSSSLINALLTIVEQGFRHTLPEVKTASFKAWGSLINCFSEDLEVLSSARYIKLLLQPLTADQKSSALDIVRIKTLWTLANNLKSKLPTLFSSVCLPILHWCLGDLDPERVNRRGSEKLTIPLKARHSGVGLQSSDDGFYAALQASGFRPTPKKATHNISMKVLGVEILIHLLQTESGDELPSSISSSFKLHPLDCPLLSNPATFSTLGQLFITAVREILCHMANEISEKLITVLWNRLLHHMRLNLETNLKKKKRETELFNAFLFTIHSVNNSNSVSSELMFKMISTFLELPKGILSSTFYGGNLNGMHGVPALCLLKLLFNEKLIIHSVKESEKFTNCVNELVSCGLENKIRILSFCQSVLDILQVFSNSFDSSSDGSKISLILNAIWSQLATDLNDHIVKSQEVNQGDSLDHDFSAVYSFLLFPLNIEDFQCVVTWTKLYKSFIWCASLVPTCKPNEVCKHIASEILNKFDPKWPVSRMSFLSSIIQCMIDNAQFNHKGFAKPNRLSYHDVSMSAGESQHATIKFELHKNLQELCTLLRLILGAVESVNQNMAAISFGQLSNMFKSIHNKDDILSLFEYFIPTLKNVKEFPKETKKQMREYFRNILQSTQKAVTSGKNSKEDLIEFVTASDTLQFLFYGFKHKDRQINQIFAEFWQKIAVENPNHASVTEVLEEDLKDCLFPIYKQLGWSCPWKDVQEPSEMRISKPSQGSYSQSSLPPINEYGAFASPMKKHSMMSPKKSPLHSTSSPAKSIIHSVLSPAKSPKRKINSLPDNTTYVKCYSPFPKPATPLTEHQKEKQSERSYIPPMYNDLDVEQTQDAAEDKTIDDKENSCEIPNLDEKQSDECDIIKTSQTIEDKKTVQKGKGTRGKRKISLKNMVAIPEDEPPNDPIVVTPPPAPRRTTRSSAKKIVPVKDSKKRRSPHKLMKVTKKKLKSEEEEQPTTVQDEDASSCSTETEDKDKLMKITRKKSEEKEQPTTVKEEDATSCSTETEDKDKLMRITKKKLKSEEEEQPTTDQEEDVSSCSTETEEEEDSLMGATEEDPEGDSFHSDVVTEHVSDDNDSYEYIEIADTSTNQTRQNISLDEESDNAIEGVTPLDDSYEYVAVADMSVNAASNRSLVCPKIDESAVDENEESVSTEDSSIKDAASDSIMDCTGTESEYETVTVADMSVNAASNQSLVCPKIDESVFEDAGSESIMDCTGNESEYEAVAMADMSTNAGVANNTTLNLDSATDTSTTDESVNESTNAGVANNTTLNLESATDISTTDESVNESHHEEDVPENGLKEKDVQEIKEESHKSDMEDDDVAQYISSDGEGDTSLENIEEDDHQETMNETEYEYVEMADTSVAVAGVANNVSSITIDSDVDEFTDCEKDQSVYVISEDENDQTKGDETTDDFSDARSFLGNDLKQMPSVEEDEKKEEVAPSEVNNTSGESAGSGDLFDSSVAEVEKSLADDSVLPSDSEDEDVQGSKEDAQKESEKEEEINQNDPPEGETESSNLGVKKDQNVKDEKDVKKLVINIPKLDVKDIDTISEKNIETEDDVFPAVTKKCTFKIPVPAIARLQSQFACPPLQSPSAKGILKRRMTISHIAVVNQPPFNKRRVSFALPISKSVQVEKTAENFKQSPRSSLQYRKKHSPRTVSRRLSLPLEKKNGIPNEVPVSPLSLRSARVAEAIANIRAKDPSCPVSPSRLPKGSVRGRDPATIGISNPTKEDIGNIENITLQKLADPQFIGQLDKSQLTNVLTSLLNITPVVFDKLKSLNNSIEKP